MKTIGGNADEEDPEGLAVEVTRGPEAVALGDAQATRTASNASAAGNAVLAAGRNRLIAPKRGARSDAQAAAAHASGAVSG
jgi:hypothetical protein